MQIRPTTFSLPPGLVSAGLALWLLYCCVSSDQAHVVPIPEETRAEFELDEFYRQCVFVGEFPIVASDRVSEYALLEAAFLVEQMLWNRPDLRAALVEQRVRFSIMACDEFTTQIPEHSDLQPADYWDRRARGLGATAQRPSVSCGEENLLGLEGDPYRAENILIHEFAHALHEMALNHVDSSFDARLEQCYEHALQSGRWLGTYASENHREYWAEGVQSWFDTNRQNDLEHNDVDNREELQRYDPELAELIASIFGDDPWRYQHPSERGEPGHLAGLDVTQAPSFAWPERLATRSPTDRGNRVPEDLEELTPLADPAASPRSDETRTATTLYFMNETSAPLHLFWLDRSGEQRSQGRILPRSHKMIATWVGHCFALVDREGAVVARFRATAGDHRAVVSE
jgi:hypothetical protein